MLTWALKAIEFRESNELPTLSEEVIYKIYSNNKPQVPDGFDAEAEKKKWVEHEGMESDFPNLEFVGQIEGGTYEKSLSGAIERGSDTTAFIMKYKNKESSSKTENGSSRLTLSFDPRKSFEAFAALADYLTENEGKPETETRHITNLKVMSPYKQGEITDSAVIYLNTINEESIKNIAAKISDLFSKNDIEMYDHTPYGMKSMEETGISFSQQGPYHSSHGADRTKVIKRAIDIEYTQHTQHKSIEEALNEALVING